MTRRRRGLFITFEGGDGAGKSTHLEFVRDTLAARGVEVLLTREPGGTPLGQVLRGLLLESDDAVSPVTELLLMAADRAEHVARIIRPALEAGKVVVSDRYADSSIAYQGYGLGLDLETVRAVNRVATGGIEPDLTLLFDLPPGVGPSRRPRPGDRIESRDPAYHERVRRGYLELAAADPGRFVIIDASQPVEAVRQRLREILEERVLSRLSG